MRCNICNVDMECRAGLDMTYHVCPDCGCVWFAQGELEHMVRYRAHLPAVPREGDEAPESVVKPPACPSCGDGVRLLAMTTSVKSNVPVLGCAVCFGRWIDKYSFHALVRFLRYRGVFGRVRKLLGR
jgi:Zn-finger nucleic acid-binding protein